MIIWVEMSKMMGCGGRDCDTLIRVDSKYSCRVCGRMLCEECSDLCEVHDAPKVVAMMYNFETEEFEKVSMEDGEWWMGFVEVLNEDCANAPHL